MKLSILCVALLICSSWVIYQQKQQIHELQTDLLVTTQKVEKLQSELDAAKRNGVGRPSVMPAHSAFQQPFLATDQLKEPDKASWMHEKQGGNPLKLQGLETPGQNAGGRK